MDSHVIETRGLTKRFGAVLAVSDLSLNVPKGGVFGLLGPNGSGKTTTMGMLLGLIKPSAGTFRLLGHDGATIDALRHVGAIVETPAFYPNLSGRANLKFFQGITQRGRLEDIDRLLAKVELSARANSKFATYSLGMKQRLGIAYALMGDPELMFLDEPTNGLDPAGMAEVRQLIKGLGTERTVVLSSHLLHEVELVCHSVAILAKGKVIAQGRVQDLLRASGATRLKTTDNASGLRVLSGLSWLVGARFEDGYLTASAPLERSWEITKALADAGVYVTEMASVQVSLEQYFLEVTSDDAPAAGAAA